MNYENKRSENPKVAYYWCDIHHRIGTCYVHAKTSGSVWTSWSIKSEIKMARKTPGYADSPLFDTKKEVLEWKRNELKARIVDAKFRVETASQRLTMFEEKWATELSEGEDK